MAKREGRLANEAWESLLTAHATLLKQIQSARLWDGVSMREYDVLYTLSKCPSALRQNELNTQVLLSQPAISRLVERLVDRGFIHRSHDPLDKRGILLELTPAGRTVQRTIGAAHAAQIARVVGGRLSRTELTELDRLTRKLAGTDTSSRPT